MSEKYPELRSQLDDTGNSAADVPIEAPNGAQSSPTLTFSSTGAASSLTIGSRDSLQGRASLLDDQNNVRTLPDNAAWNTESDGDVAHNLPPSPPPTDIINVPDSNAISWPLFRMDTDWQFNFDTPFTAEQAGASTGTASTQLTELEMSQFYISPTQDSDSGGCPRELLEYLSLNGKVSNDNEFPAFVLTVARRGRRAVSWVRTWPLNGRRQRLISSVLRP